MNPKDIDLPFEAIVAECTSLLERMDELLGGIEPLTPTEIRRTLKFRKGAAPIVRELAAQCSALAITHAGIISVEEMTRAMERAQTVERTLERLDLVRARLDASRLRASSASWASAMTLYALLRSLSLRDDSVRNGLAPVVAFFKARPRKWSAARRGLLIGSSAARGGRPMTP